MPFELIPHSPVVGSIGWALIHFVWQGMVLAIICKVGLALFNKSSSQLRYLFALSILLLMFASAITTAAITFSSPPLTFKEVQIELTAERLIYTDLDVDEATSYALTIDNGNDVGNQEPWLTNLNIAKRWVSIHMYIFVGGWILGVLLLSFYLIFGYFHTQKVKLEDVSELPETFRNRFDSLMTRLGIDRAVDVFESARVYVPSVIGWLRPVVLLPGSAITGLAPMQLEAILAHELAHIRRHDYIINLVQTIIEILLFFHPATWWVSSQIRLEREHCCDDIAVSVCGDVRAYVAALAELESMRDKAPQLAVAGTGSSLVTRVKRLVRPPGQNEVRFGIQSISVLVVILTMAVLIASAQFSATESEDQIQRISWTERDGDRIMLVNLQGQGPNLSIEVSGRPLDVEISENDNYIYWSDERGRIQRALLDKPERAEVLVAQREPIPSIVIDEEMGEIYWAKPTKIMKAKLDGSESPQTIKDFLIYPMSIQLDLEGQMIYWTDMMGGNVQRASLDGQKVETLALGRGRPVSLSLDLVRGYVYWTELETQAIYRTRLDGTGLEEVLKGAGTPLGLFLDAERAKLYWTDRDLGTIMRANLNGSSTELLYSGLQNPVSTTLN